MQECNLMEAQAQKLSLLFSSYAADSKVESAQLDEGLMGALTGGAIGTGLGAFAGGAIKSGADSIKTDELKKSVGAAADNAKNELVDATHKAADASKAAELASTAQNAAQNDFAAAQNELTSYGDGSTVTVDAGDNLKININGKATEELDKLIDKTNTAYKARQAADELASKTATARDLANDKLQQAGKAAEWTKDFDPSKGDFGIDKSGNVSGLSKNAPKIKASNLAKAADFTSKNSTAVGAATGGVTGAAVGHLATSKNKDKKNVSEDEDSNTIAAESMKVYEMFRSAVDEEEQASNAKKAGYSAAGAFLGTAACGPMSGAIGALAGGAAGAAMTNTDGEQRSQQLGRAAGAGVGGAVGAALTGGSLAGTAVGGAAGAMLGDTVGKIVGNKHSNPTPVRNRNRRSRPTP